MGLFSWLSSICPLRQKANPPPTPPLPVSTAPLKAGVYLNPWMESPTTLAALPDLRPGVLRINYPAFPLMAANVNAAEAARLVGLIENQIRWARSMSVPLIVTTLGTRAPATTDNIISNVDMVAAYYAGVAKQFPGCAFEIGNEAEIRSGGGDAPLIPSAYAAVFEVHARAIRAADPYARIVTAGTSGFAVPWIRDVLALTNPDAVGVHPYGTPPQAYASAVAQIGTKIPVWFTEWGLENISPQQVTDYYAYARGVVPVAVLFCLSDLSAELGSIAGNRETHQPFGLIDAYGNRRPSYGAAKAAFARP